MPADDQADAVAHVVQPVQDGQVALARDAEDVVCALPRRSRSMWLGFPSRYLYAFASAATAAASNLFTSSIKSLVISSAAGTLAPITFHLSRKSW